MLTRESVEEMKNEEVKTKTELTAFAALSKVDIFERFSSYSKIVQVVARILRWRNRVDKTHRTYRSLLISADEFEQAELDEFEQTEHIPVEAWIALGNKGVEFLVKFFQQSLARREDAR